MAENEQPVEEKIEVPQKKSPVLSKVLMLVLFVFVSVQILFLVAGSGFSNQITGLASGVTSGSSSGDQIALFSKLPLTTEGYNKLLEYDKTITLSDGQKKQFAGFDVRLPCCGFKVTSEDEHNDCRCGHHLAYAGLIKYGLTNDWSRDQIQQEIDQWKVVFYPVCAQNKALCDL